MTDSSKSRILVVDDNPFNREMLKEFLKPEGFSLEEARNGKEALEHLKASEFRLIFMDLLMPGMDGFETIRRIRDMGVRTPIIIVSSMSSKEDRQRCLEAGGNDFLPKPIDVKKIRTLVRQYGTDRPEPLGNMKSLLTDENRVTRSPGLNFSDCHILFVEEDDDLAAQYDQYLKHFGFEVTCVSNGDEAWELFLEHEHRFRIIISNIFTSGMDGLGLLARIKRDHPGMLMFIYAQDHDADTFQLAIQLGADGIVTQAELKRAITDMIESALYRAMQQGTQAQDALTASQVRKAQAELIKFGCAKPCDSIDIAYSSLTDAGGDMACCRRFNLAGRCGIMLGDVAGHNVMSSYISAISIGILTSHWEKNQYPLNLLKAINAELNKSDYDKYHLCATALLWDRRRRKIKTATAGNPGGLLVSMILPGGICDFQELPGGGMCLGLLKEDHLFLEDEIEFPDQTYLFLFSDGISETDVMECLSSGRVNLNRESIRGLCQEILDSILEKGGQDDDMVLIALKPPEKNPFFLKRPGFSFSDHHEFSSSYKAADKACRWAADQCIPDKIPTGKDPCFIFLAVREALINAVRHGNKFDPETFVDISLFFRPGELRIEISDQGPGFELPDAIRKMQDIDVFQSGGRGLSVMYSVADSISIDGGTVSLSFREESV